MRLDVQIDKAKAIQYRCFLDGVDISIDCFAADDIEGWADCYRRDSIGHLYRIDEKAVCERRYGTVEFRPK